MMQILKEIGEVVAAVVLGNDLIVNYEMTDEERSQICEEVLVIADSAPG